MHNLGVAVNSEYTMAPQQLTSSGVIRRRLAWGLVLCTVIDVACTIFGMLNSYYWTCVLVSS